MEPPSRRAWVYDWLWFLAWGVASSLWCWTAARELGATFDEPIYIQRGLQAWRTGSHEGLLRLGNRLMVGRYPDGLLTLEGEQRIPCGPLRKR